MECFLVIKECFGSALVGNPVLRSSPLTPLNGVKTFIVKHTLEALID